jgi:hypothetical protein
LLMRTCRVIVVTCAVAMFSATGARAQGLSVADTTISDARELVNNRTGISSAASSWAPLYDLRHDGLVSPTTTARSPPATSSCRKTSKPHQRNAEFDTATSLSVLQHYGNADPTPRSAGRAPPTASVRKPTSTSGDSIRLLPEECRSPAAASTCVQPTPL